MADEDLNEELKSNSRADWGKEKYNYYYTEYVDQDYPNELTSKQSRLAAIEQEEAIRIQKKLLSTIDNAEISDLVFEQEDQAEGGDNLIELIRNSNRAFDKIPQQLSSSITVSKPREKSVKFADQETEQPIDVDARQRRPINTAIEKNRGLTPYKNKVYRNPRVKHKMKFKKAMSKRRRAVKEYIAEYNRYTGETTGIKSSTIRSIKLC